MGPESKLNETDNLKLCSFNSKNSEKARKTFYNAERILMIIAFFFFFVFTLSLNDACIICYMVLKIISMLLEFSSGVDSFFFVNVYTERITTIKIKKGFGSIILSHLKIQTAHISEDVLRFYR